MNINELGRVVDYLYDRVKPNFPNEYPEDVYGVIYNKVKKNGIKNMKYEDVIKENIKEDFIFNVKPRRHATEPTPIVTALGISRRVNKENIIWNSIPTAPE